MIQVFRPSNMDPCFSCGHAAFVHLNMTHGLSGVSLPLCQNCVTILSQEVEPHVYDRDQYTGRAATPVQRP